MTRVRVQPSDINLLLTFDNTKIKWVENGLLKYVGTVFKVPNEIVVNAYSDVLCKMH